MAGIKRSGFIDSTRAIAALLVFLVHSTEMLKDFSSSGTWIANFAFDFNFGRVGVVAFFAISGFLIPSSLRGEVGQGSKHFLISRFFRLFPAFWVSIPLSILTHYWIEGKNISIADTVYNISMVPYLFGVPLANGAYWTLSLEIVFYALCFGLFVTSLLKYDITLAVICAILACSAHFHQIGFGVFSYHVPDKAVDWIMNIFVMFFGALIRRVYDNRHLDKLSSVLFVAFVMAIFVYMPVHFLKQCAKNGFNIDNFRFLCGYTGGIGVFCMMFIFRGVRINILQWFGRISYSFYLLHGCCIHALYFVLKEVQRLDGARLEVYEVVAFVISTASAAGLYYFVEVPCMEVGKKISARDIERVSARAVV
jgi:peptidoglycan/LPS O-acetylase OafA/YrhL